MACQVVNVRSSSWAELFDCAYRWEAKHILGMRSPVGARGYLGTSLHHATAVYDTSRMQDEGLTVDDAAAEFVDKYQHPDEDVDWSDFDRRKGEQIGVRLTAMYCQQISPRYQFRAIELRPDPLDIEVPEHDIIIQVTGAMDRSRIRNAGAGVSIQDLKSGVTAVDRDGVAVTKGHWIQLGLYELLTIHSLGIPIDGPAEIIGLQTSSSPRVGTGEVHNARHGLLGTPEEPGLIQMAAHMLSTGLFPPNPKSSLCSKKYCVRWPLCRFRGS